MQGKRNKVQREVDSVLIADLYRQGNTFRQIADKVSSMRTYSLTHVTIKRDFDKVLKRWREAQATYVDNFIAIQLQQIQEMKQEAWAEYKKSKQPLKTKSEKRKALVKGVDYESESRNLIGFIDSELDSLLEDSGEDEDRRLKDVDIVFTNLSLAGSVEVDQSLKVTERLGNPRYLELIAKLLDQEAKLLGFYQADTPDVVNTSVVIVNMPAPVSTDYFTPHTEIEEHGE